MSAANSRVGTFDTSATMQNVAPLHGLNFPMPVQDATPVDLAQSLGQAYLSRSIGQNEKGVGHYLTPATIARFMAESFSYAQEELRVLDPGSGSGILSAAVCEAASLHGIVKRMHVDAYEIEPSLAGLTNRVLEFAKDWIGQQGIELTYDVRLKDFVLDQAAALNGMSQTREHSQSTDNQSPKYDVVISNPPYFKIGKHDPRAVASAAVVQGQPNIYTLFMAISAELLSPSGELSFIVPRSFAAGTYFRKFREQFFSRTTPTAIHLFESRKDVFKNQAVLQESLVLTSRRRPIGTPLDDGQVIVSHSKADHDIATRRSLTVNAGQVLDPASRNNELLIPNCKEDLMLAQAMREWPNTLHSLGLEISTGPVVPFRATQFLSRSSSDNSVVPLLWLQHVRPMQTAWPSPTTNKPQWIRATPTSMRLLVADVTYILLRRFSAKEEERRLVAAPLIRGSLGASMVGLENHLNYVRGVSRELDDELAYGLVVLYNSTFLDRYFRMSNGNTQVSATELRAMPLPDERDIRSIGARVQTQLGIEPDLNAVDILVAEVLTLPSELLVGS